MKGIRSKPDLNHDQEVLMHVATESIPDRIGRLNPSSTFDEAWQRHQINMESLSFHRPNIKKRVLATSIIIAMVGLITAVSFSPDVRAALGKFPFIKMLLEDGGLDDSGLSQIEKQNLGMEVNQSVTDKDIRFTVDEVFYDGVQIVLNYDVEYLKKKDKITKKDASVYYDLKITGAQPDSQSTHKFSIVGDSTFIGSTLIDASNIWTATSCK